MTAEFPIPGCTCVLCAFSRRCLGIAAPKCGARWAKPGEKRICELAQDHTGPHRDGEIWYLDGWPWRERVEVTRLAKAKAPLERLGEVEYALGELAEQIAYGGERPGRVPGDWRKLPREVLIGKAIRHLLSAAAGQKLDAEGRSHLVAALADCAMAAEKERA